MVLAGVTCAPALAGPMQLITNGTFAGTPAKLTTNGLSGWTNNQDYGGGAIGYNFLYNPATADTGSSPLQLWGTNNGGLNAITASPGGGYFVGMDGAYEQGALSQTLSSLVVGTDYYLSFWWAGAQQYSFSGVTTEQFAVALLGGTTVLAANATCATTGVVCTNVLTDQSHGFTGWNFAGFTFVATATQETLSFLAIGTPGGEPPFSLLSDVSMTIPEPSTLVLLAGLGGLVLARRRRNA